jgi:BASS family bile acid:Na+ symporter
MDAKQLIILALQVAILGAVFGFGLNATRDDLLYLVRRPGLLLRSLHPILVVVPLLTVVLVRLCDLRSTVEIVLVALAVSPAPPLLPQRETKAGGRRSYGLGLMVVVGIVAIAAVPLMVELLARVFERPLAMGPGAIARIVLLAVVLPLVAGMTVRALLPRIAERLQKPARLVANGLLLVAALALAAGSWRAIWAAIGDGTVLAMTGLLVFAESSLRPTARRTGQCASLLCRHAVRDALAHNEPMAGGGYKM